MKSKQLVTLLFLTMVSTGLWAQEVRVNPYAAYAFDDKFDSYFDRGAYYEGTLKGGFQWGVGAEYMADSYTGIELTYLRQDTNSPTWYQTYDQFTAQYTDFNVAINYLLLGGNRYIQAADGKVEGFGGLMAGMVIANIENPDNGRDDNSTKFAWGLKAGGIYWLSDVIGIKVQAQLLSAVQAMGGGFYFGTGGASAGLNSYSTLYQFTLGGGLTFKIE